MPLTEQQAIEKLWRYGHFANPANPDTLNVGGPTFEQVQNGEQPEPPKDLSKLTINHPLVKQALRSYQEQMGFDADRLSNEHHARPMIMDGEFGPATEALLQVERCAVPDYQMGAEPAVGTGSWSRCHGIGNFHAATVYINKSTMPSFLQPVWEQVWANVVASYEAIGLRWIPTDDSGNHNTSLTWVRPDGGWIGLAIVGRSQSCGSKIWSRYDQNYRGGSSTASIIQQWTSLVKHELGHNTGLQHSRGGVMNPSIVNGLPTSWAGDPSEPQLKRWFGGEPIPNSNPNPPGPGPGPIPPTGSGPRISFRFEIPEGTKPGTYDFIGVPKPVV